MSERELENHELQRDNAKEIQQWMRDKFTNEKLYSWMAGQLTTLHRQMFELANRMAETAQKAYEREIGTNPVIIKPGAFDSQRAGLLAGEKLVAQLHRLDASYLDSVVREYDITTSIALSRLDPVQLLKLRYEGACEFRVPEWYFDLHDPGSYFRRIKTVALTLPAVAGPHTTIGTKLTLLSNEIRPTAAGALGAPDHSRLESIVTSSAQQDIGVFDGGRDGRYMPFEGAGAVSTWRIELPEGPAQFDHSTIADAVLTMSYTAREGGAIARADAVQQLQAKTSGPGAGPLDDFSNAVPHLVSLRHEFPDEWNRAESNFEASGVFTLSVGLTEAHRSYLQSSIGGDVQTLVLPVFDGSLPASTASNHPKHKNPKIDIVGGKVTVSCNVATSLAGRPPSEIIVIRVAALM